MSSEEEKNKALARRFLEAREKRDLAAVDEMMAPDYVIHARLLPGQQPGREGAIRAIAQLSAAISNASVHFEDQVAAKDKVVTRFIVHATYDRGELMGVAPTGRQLNNVVIVILRISGGKIAEEWGMGTLGARLRRQHLEHEIRELVEQEIRVASSIQQASLPGWCPP